MGAGELAAVAFDAVGTLIRLREPVGRTYARLARRHDLALDAARLEAAFRAARRAMPPMVFPGTPPADVAHRERAWWTALVHATVHRVRPDVPPAAVAACADTLFAHYATGRAWRRRAGAARAVARARAAGWRVGVVSDFDHRLPGVLHALGLGPFDAVVLPGDVAALKPAAAVIETAARRLGVTPPALLYVGDDAPDVLRAIGALGPRVVDAGGSAPLDHLVATHLPSR